MNLIVIVTGIHYNNENWYQLFVIILFSIQMASTLNPEIFSQTTSYKLYSNDKNNRLKAQSKGKQAASNVNYLYRKAKNSARDLNQTQLTLMNLYSKKLTQYDDQRKKSQHRKMQQQKLREMKNISSLNRYLHSLKKEQNNRDILKRNQTSAKVVKDHHRESEDKMKDLRQSTLSNLKERNQANSRAQKMRNQYSLQGSFNNKRKLSSTINGTLSNKQSILTQREMERLNTLSKKQEELLGIVERTRRHKEKLQGQIQRTKEMPYNQLCTEVLTLSRKRPSRRSSRSPF